MNPRIKRLRLNPMLLTDGYKIDHRRQYVEETRGVYSNMTPRSSRIAGIDEVIVVGPQYYALSTLIDIWNVDFFDVPWPILEEEFLTEMTEYTLSREAAEAIGTAHWKQLHDLGYLPIRIKALPEGTRCPIKVPVYTIKETHPDFFWMPNFIETDMSAELWGFMTAATLADKFYQIFDHWAILSGADRSFVKFQGHNFSYRGMLGREAACIVDMGHLTSFVGSDTIPGRKYMKAYYGADQSQGDIISCSVWATEHAVMCSATGFYILKNGLTWEKYGEAEFEVFKRLITRVYPTGIVSIVSDTWDLWKVLSEYLPLLKEEILARDGKVVIRPDSGDPVKIMTGWMDNELIQVNGEWYHKNVVETLESMPVQYHILANAQPINEWERKGVVQCLFDIFGGEMNELGFIHICDKVGAIYGDSINMERANDICQRLVEGRNFESTSWVAGIGSYTYQYVTRDTFGFAQKATNTTVEWEGKLVDIAIFKKPKTQGNSEKNSAKGLLQVWKDQTDRYVLHDNCTWAEEEDSCLETIFEDGKMIKLITLPELRSTIRSAA